MNSVGDEAVRRELLARLQTVGAGMSGGRRYVGGGVDDYGGKGTKEGAAKNPYLTYKNVSRSGLFNGSYDEYLASLSLIRKPKVKSGRPRGRPKKSVTPVMTPAEVKKAIKMYRCTPPRINNPQTGRCLKPTSKLGRQVVNTRKILNPKTGRYVLRSGKIGKLLGGTVYE
jgi:hypothetical protein